MAKRRSPLSTLFVLALVFGAVYLYFTPYLAMKKLQDAAKAGDTQALNELVDFPALRESVKQNVRGAVENSVSRSHNPLAVLGGMLAGAVAAPLVDTFVTPDGIAALTEGARPGSGPDARTHVDTKDVKVKRGYESFDRFVVHFEERDSGRERLALVLRRDGLTHWRLSAVRRPGAN